MELLGSYLICENRILLNADMSDVALFLIDRLSKESLLVPDFNFCISKNPNLGIF